MIHGSPVAPFVDAFKAILDADAVLLAGDTGWRGPTSITGQPSKAQRETFPYLVLGRRNRVNDSGAMQKVGGHVHLQLDGWSDRGGPFEMSAILSRVALVLERRKTLNVSGFTYIEGSLTCETEDVFSEPDDDAPDRNLYHGVQMWVAEIHES